MKQKLQIVWTLVFTLCAGAMFAQRDTLAYWGFNAGTADYLYWGSDEETGGTRLYAYNEYKNKKDATFGAFREGMNGEEAVSFYENNHTLVTTTNFGTNCISQSAWQKDDALGRTTRYWLLDSLTTLNKENIEVSLYLVSVGTVGMTQFRFGYKVGDGAWVDDVFKDVRTGASSSSKIGSNPADLWTHVLPAACNNQVKVAFRWCVNDIAVGGGPLGSGGISRVDNVTVTGIRTSTGLKPASPTSVAQITGNELIAKDNISITVYNQVGAIVRNNVLSNGASVTLPQGFNIIKISSPDRSTEMIKTVIK
ncbi:MAG: hypothetical protein VB102_07070 [Paludibacter sp.]|nr:hypothetical protein [Paludibacter sp.]